MLSDQCSLLNIWYIFPSINLFFIFMTVPDKHLCPYCESIHWWGIDAQVSQDVVWENSWNFLIMGSTCFSSYQTDRNSLYKYFVITISLNVSTIDGITALHAKKCIIRVTEKHWFSWKMVLLYLQTLLLLFKQHSILFAK